MVKCNILGGNPRGGEGVNRDFLKNLNDESIECTRVSTRISTMRTNLQYEHIEISKNMERD